MNTTLNPNVLRWARTRAKLDHSALAKKIIGKTGTADDVKEWEKTGEISFHRAELLAEKTHTPFGYLFLDSPPAENLPIKDFRTVGSAAIQDPSPDLLDVIYQCQRRQSWYREYLISTNSLPLSFVAKFSTSRPISETAQDMRSVMGIGASMSARANSWTENLTLHIEAAEEVGILLMRSGIVDNNVTRKLLLSEFRGFALSDIYAPLVFINSRDAKAAQLFTLVHELAHIWIGESAVSNPNKTYVDGGEIERYCNEVAAEVLVPISEIRARWDKQVNPRDEITRFAAQYKVSTLVIARRAKDAGFLNNATFEAFYDAEVRRYFEQQPKRLTSEEKKKGGNFYNSLKARAGDRFCRALIARTLEGRTQYREAFRLLGINNTEAFNKFAAAKYRHLMK